MLICFNSGLVLEKVAEYFNYNYKNRNREDDVPDMEIPPELCLELLMAADFLDSKITLVTLKHQSLTSLSMMYNIVIAYNGVGDNLG